jgi:hypothetical protein
VKINITEDTSIREISAQLADIIDNPTFLDFTGGVQNCVIAMYQAVNKFIIENKLDTEADW